MNTKTIYAVFGNPIQHSLSPQLFNSCFVSYRKQAYYTRIEAAKPETVVNLIKRYNIEGANITTPLKENLIGFLDNLSDEAQMIKGVNVIANKSGILKGYNTDHYGVVKALKNSNVKIANRNCLVLGAGAAARAAVYGLTTNGANVIIANRTFSKANDIARQFGCNAVELSSLAQIVDRVDVIVSAVLPTANLLENITLRNNPTVLDANYCESKFSSYCLTQACNVVSGKEWLLYQAVASYEIFFGVKPKIEIMQNALNHDVNHSVVKTVIISPQMQDIDFDGIDFAKTKHFNNTPPFDE